MIQENFVYYNVLINNHSHIQYHTNHQCVARNSGRSNLSRINKANAIQNKLSKKCLLLMRTKHQVFTNFGCHMEAFASDGLPGSTSGYEG